MKALFAFLCLAVFLPRVVATAEPASAHAESAAVVNVVQQFFDALHHKDGESSAVPTPSSPAPRPKTPPARPTETSLLVSGDD